MTTEDLMKLADAYAEARHLNGAAVYNDKTAYDRQALLDALEALGREVAELKLRAGNGYSRKIEELTAERDQARAELAAIRAQEPVAWQTFDGEGGYEYRSYEDNESYADDWQRRNPKYRLSGLVTKLYAAPVPTQDVGALVEALESVCTWMESQSEAQSKGGHATFDLMMLREQRDIARAALSRAQAAPARVVPDGYVLVPVEPTRAMDEASYATLPKNQLHLGYDIFRRSYRAMLAAAPQQKGGAA